MKRQPAKDFQDLIVWQKSHRFVLSVYQQSKSLLSNPDKGSRLWGYITAPGITRRGEQIV
jgi:hypothetical protein